MSNPANPEGKDATGLIRRLLFLLLVLGLSFLYLVVLFRGIAEPMVMDQAQIGRNVSRGEGFKTQNIRPIVIKQAQDAGLAEVPLGSMTDTFHAPLNPLLMAAVFKMTGVDDFERHVMKPNEMVYGPDRVVASISVVCFLMAVGVTYLLVLRIFDKKIAGVTALLMVLCDLMWQCSLSGQPQMLMLLLFSCGAFFAYRALEQTTEGRLALGQLVTAGIFFCLMALANWIAVWLVVGFAIFAAVAIRPRGIGALCVGGLLILFSAYSISQNMQWTGSPAGTAGLTAYGGLTGDQNGIMRTLDPSSEANQVLFQLKYLVLNLTRTMLSQANGLYTNLGGMIAAPVFFLALLHPFKRPAIARFRWMILLMWLAGILGISIFGGVETVTGPNQIQILFAPLMAAYGLALLSILWSRLNLSSHGNIIRYGHFYLVILISAGPLLLNLPRQISQGLKSAGGGIQWPYYPLIVNQLLREATTEKDIIVSDQPWAVAWYADRTSIWLPRSVGEFETLEELGKERGFEIAGVYLTPLSFETNPLFGPASFQNLEEFAPLMMAGPNQGILGRDTQDTRFAAESLAEFNTRYPYTQPFYLGRMTYYSSRSPREE